MDINNMVKVSERYVEPKVYETTKATEPANETINSGNEKKKEYLELAVGTKEKELNRLGLKGNEDGVVTIKNGDEEKNKIQELIEQDKEKKLKKEEKEEIEEKKLEKKEKLKEEEEEENKECETCANRKYQDGSDEMVSFKSASHIAPEAAATRVRAHEQEHVSNAFEKAEAKDGKVVMASIALHTSICPECGRVYVAGGTTTTNIRYNNDDYASNARKQDETVVPGMNVDSMT